MKRSQLIATILAVACVGSIAPVANACDSRLQPVGELVTTRTVVNERPLYRARIIERPAPIAERVTTRRITTVKRASHLEPVGEVISTRRAYLDPVGERTVMDRTADGIARVVAAPFQIAAAPFRALAGDPQPEIVGERVTRVTRVTEPRYTKKRVIKRTTTTTLAPVGERLILCP